MSDGIAFRGQTDELNVVFRFVQFILRQIIDQKTKQKNPQRHRCLLSHQQQEITVAVATFAMLYMPNPLQSSSEKKKCPKNFCGNLWNDFQSLSFATIKLLQMFSLRKHYNRSFLGNESIDEFSF